MVGVILRCRMKLTIEQYTTSYYGVYFDEKQMRRLRRIASDQAIPVKTLIKSYMQKGFANTERYIFSQGN